MKYLVTILSIVSVASASPITAGYGKPLAPVVPIQVPVAPVDPIVPIAVPAQPIQPVEVINLPVQGAPVVQPDLRSFPFPPSPFSPLARTLPAFSQQALPLVANPALIQRAGLRSPLAQPLVATRNQLPVSLPTPLVHQQPQLAPRTVTPVAIPAAVPTLPSSQFQAQDEIGGFSFGYQNVNSAKQESRSPDGVTRGAYSYVDANGIEQRVEYIADPVNGFRVIGTNIPVAGSAPLLDTPEVALAKAEFQKAFDAAVARNAAPVVVDDIAVKAEPVGPVRATLELRKKRSTAGYGAPLAPVVTPVVSPVQVRTFTVQQPIALPLAANPVPLASALPLAASPVQIPRAASALPLVASPLPIARATSALPLAANVVASPQAVISSSSSQYQAGDELGGSSFGYTNQNSARQEVRSPDGVTQGSYSYVDGAGITQTVNYIADALGFRVTGTNLPVAVSA